MPKVTFNQDRSVNDGSGTTFEAGKTYDLPTASCERWIKRGAAAYAEGSGPASEPAVQRAPRPNLNKMDISLGEGGQAGMAPIPEGWADLPWIDLLTLAKQFDADVRSKEDAVAAIELELEKRSKK